MKNGRRPPSRNRREILAELCPGRTHSRRELALRTGLSPATVSRITRELVRGKVLTEEVRPRAAAGRPERLLEVNPDRGTVLGVSLLAPAARVLVMNLRGEVLKESREAIPWNQGKAGILGPLRRAVERAARARRLAGAGLALPGQWDREAGVSLSYPRVPDWRAVPLRRLLEEWAGVPATLVGYAPALAVAEHTRLADPADLLCVEVAENVAMGAIVNGRVVEGVSGNAGELGHITVDKDGPVCYCGNRGCLETVGTCAAVEDEVRGSEAAAGVYGRARPVSFERVVARAREGDTYSTRLLGRVARMLGIGLATALNLFNPGLLVLSGRFFEAGDLVLAPLRASIPEHALASTSRKLSIEQSTLGPKAAALGAGFMAVREAVRRL
jgi:predicted NBD/HSP70 family sugar kinase